MLLLRLFKNNRTGGIIFVILVAVLSCLKSFINPGHPVEWHGMPLYNLIFGRIYTIPFLAYFSALLINLLISLILVRVNLRFSLIEERTFMPALFFLIIVNAFPSLHAVNPMLTGSLFYLLGFYMILISHKEGPDSLKIFNASLVFFIGILFYAKLIWFLPIFWVIMITIRQVTWRELIYPVLAALFVGVLLITYYWVIEDDAGKLLELLRENLRFEGKFQPVHLGRYLFTGYLLFLVFISSGYIITRFQARKIIIRNIYQVLLYMFLFSIIFFLLISGFQQGTIYFTAIPLTFLLTNYFNQKRNAFIKELFIWILIGLSAFVQFTA